MMQWEIGADDSSEKQCWTIRSRERLQPLSSEDDSEQSKTHGGTQTHIQIKEHSGHVCHQPYQLQTQKQSTEMNKEVH